jgi:uncharacterized protein involved in exopolysaccharide biosynthesis
MEQTLDIGKYIDGVRRRLWLVALIFIPGALIATGIAYILPPVYQSTARILVESQKIPTSLAQSTVTVGAAERLQLIEQRVLARENVLDVIERLQLFENLDNLTPTDKVDLVRQSTGIQLIEFSGGVNPNTGQRMRRRSNQPFQVSAFTITYSAKSAPIAARVANELVTRVLELNLQSRSEQAQETHNFFRREVERLAADLISLESEIANYKKQNEGSLPSSLQIRQGTVQNLVTQIFSIDQQRKQFTEELRTLQGRLRTMRSLPAPPQSLSAEERQLAALKAQLAQEETFFY